MLVPEEQSETRNVDVESRPYLRMRAAIAYSEISSYSLDRMDKPPLERLVFAPVAWTCSESAAWGFKADVWALAVSWLSIFGELPVPEGRIDATRHKALHDMIREQISLLHISGVLVDFLDQVSAMLAWDPLDRSNVSQALVHTPPGRLSVDGSAGK